MARLPSPAATPVEADHVAAIRARYPVTVPFKADGSPDLRGFIDRVNALPVVLAADAWADSHARRLAVSAATASLCSRSYAAVLATAGLRAASSRDGALARRAWAAWVVESDFALVEPTSPPCPAVID